MSRSYNIVGIRPPDEKFLAMKKVWDACKEAKVQVPSDVVTFFDGIKPDASGVVINLENHPSVTVYKAEWKDGFQVEIDKLPSDIKYVRFYIS